MKSKLFLLTMLAFMTALFAFRIKDFSAPGKSSQANNRKYISKNILRCSPDWNEIEKSGEADIPPIPGAGIYKWKISTQNDSAQFYFNQGINMYYSFHIIEAMASFKKASRFDPSCAMLKWAQALTYGPNINDLGYAASPAALAAIEEAVALSSKSSPKEKILIAAQRIRYAADSTVARETLNQLYADEMKKAYQKYPADPDIAALYADAMMLQHPWDLWNNNGTAKPWTAAIETVLEKLLAKMPDHPGANHYYIHVMEASPYFAKAKPSADRLGKLTPGLSHTLHMPSHIYLRTGQYNKGIAVNLVAVKSYQHTIPLYEPVTGSAFLYQIHNLHMQTNNAIMAGQSSLSYLSAKETANSLPAEYLSTPGALGNTIQYIYMTPVLTAVRFGDWAFLLNYPQPSPTEIYSNVLYRFGRGMALAGQAKFTAARFELTQLQELMKDSSLALPLAPFSSALEGAIVAESLLSGTIALQQNNFSEAIAAFEKAVQTEDAMVYNEPRDWLLNPKHYLGNAYIKAGRFDEAIKTLEKDLRNNNENGWALFGLWQAMKAKKKDNEAGKLMSRFSKAFEKADIKLYGPVF